MGEANFADLREIVRELAQAQVRTEARLETLTAHVDTLAVRMEELAQAQLRTEHEVTHLRRTMETQLGGLGHAGGYRRRRPSGTL